MQQYDVCIVCALPEEAKAFLRIVAEQCDVTFTERSSPRYQYPYRAATILNHKDEPLELHLSWLPSYGPQQMIRHLTRVLEEFQPRFVLMTGICAGDAQKVQLGDLVVAERVFTYDNGKISLDEQGRTVHEHDVTTYQPNPNLLQYLGLFDAWKSLVGELARKLTPSLSQIHCHIKPMASGSAVRADSPFEDVRVPVRGTVAIDMESAALGMVMSDHPLIPWLVVKGVCDYADSEKDDTYHDFAARASALYALSCIQDYVANERLPRRLDWRSPESKDPYNARNSANFRAGSGTPLSTGDFTQKNVANVFDGSAKSIQNREIHKGARSTQQKVFISYSHTDVKWFERLKVHLTPLEREGIIVWDDTKIVPGDHWKEAISEALEMVSIAITLVSADFLASKFITQYELPKLLTSAENDGTVILPVIVSPCLFNESGLTVFQAVNPPDKPLSAMKRSDREQMLVEVAKVIRKRLN